VGGGSVLKGSGGEGGPEGWAPCGGEQEREREQGQVGHAVARPRRARAARAALQWRAAGSARRETTR
jgi:hypothetical protein